MYLPHLHGGKVATRDQTLTINNYGQYCQLLKKRNLQVVQDLSVIV